MMRMFAQTFVKEINLPLTEIFSTKENVSKVASERALKCHVTIEQRAMITMADPLS